MLFDGLSIEDSKAGQSRPKNRGISFTFVAMKIIEQWGTGIPRIIEMCKEYDLQEPEFVEIGMDFRVNLYRKQMVDFGENQSIDKENQSFQDENQSLDNKNQSIENFKQLIYTIDGNSGSKENAWMIFENVHCDNIFGRIEIMEIT